MWCLFEVCSLYLLIYFSFIHSLIRGLFLQINHRLPLWWLCHCCQSRRGWRSTPACYPPPQTQHTPTPETEHRWTINIIQYMCVCVCVWVCICVHLCVSCHWPSFIQRVSNKRPVRCWHSLQTGAVFVALREIGCPSPASSPPHSSCLSSLGVKPLQWHTDTHTQR